MSARWVAGTVRARAMARRRVGPAGARAVAGSGSLDDAVDALARSPYGPRVRVGATLPDAAHGIAATLLWNLRVLAGWMPARGVERLRVLAGWFEIANVDEHRLAMAGRSTPAPFELGALAAAWPMLAATASPDELRQALGTSAWGDPGGSGPREIQLAMRMGWAERVVARVPEARTWALGAAALVVARERLGRREPLPESAAATATSLLGAGWRDAGSLDALRGSLGAPARWALDGLADIRDLWRWEVRWWRRVRIDARGLLARSTFGSEHVVGAAALLAADAWLALGALETAARGPATGEAFDAVV